VIITLTSIVRRFFMSLDERKQMWQQRIEAYKLSGGTSVKAWCKLNQISPQSMYQWMKRLQMEPINVAPSSTQWIAVEPSDVCEKTTSLLIVTLGDVSIEIKEGFNRALFKEVLQILQTHVR